jgi:PPM family protein phosphatase
MKGLQEVAVGKCTDRGAVRELNEDSLLYWEPAEPEALEREGRIALVADGMGGAAAGEIASHLATKLILDEYNRLDHTRTNGERFVNAFRAANRELYLKTLQDNRLVGMGTTCSGVLLHGGKAYVAHAGDSRVYLIRGEQIAQVTSDHVVAPGSNIITRSFGTEPSLEVDAIGPIELEPGDIFVLCTDGLWSLVTDDELQQLTSKQSPSEAARQLVDLANSRGGHDNVTVLIVAVGAESGATAIASLRNGGRGEARRKHLVSVLLLILILLGGAVFGFLAGRQYEHWQVTSNGSGDQRLGSQK